MLGFKSVKDLSISECESYLMNNTDDDLIPLVKEKLCNLIQTSSSLIEIRDKSESYSNNPVMSEFVGLTQCRLEQLSNADKQAFWSCSSKQDYEKYLHTWFGGNYVDAARDKIKKITEIEMLNITDCCKRLNIDKETAVTVGSKGKTIIIGIDAPTETEKLIIARIHNILDADKRAFQSCSEIAEYEEYLASWPDGLYREEASLRMSEIADKIKGNIAIAIILIIMMIMITIMAQ